MTVQETPVELVPGAARSSGPSVQDILDRERVPVPEVLRRTSYYYMGSDDLAKERYFSGKAYAEYVAWRAQHPADDLVTELLNVEFDDLTGERRKLSIEPNRSVS